MCGLTYVHVCVNICALVYRSQRFPQLFSTSLMEAGLLARHGAHQLHYSSLAHKLVLGISASQILGLQRGFHAHSASVWVLGV